MNEAVFNYQLSENTVVFQDTLTQGAPYCSKNPRDHESVFFVTNGTLLYEKCNEKTYVPEGQVGYIARGAVDKSSAHNCEKVSYIAVNFFFDKEDLTPTLPFSTLCSKGIAYKYESMFNDALNIFVQKAPGYMTICNGIIMQIIGMLYNEYKLNTLNLKKISKIESSAEFLRNNYSNSDLKIRHLAEISNMSEKHFRRIFSDIYHKNPYLFLLEFRIDKAKILLQNTQKSIGEVAEQCGFSDVYSFSHSFKKHTGFSPNNYRK